MTVTNDHDLESGNILTLYDVLPIGRFTHEAKNAKMCIRGVILLQYSGRHQSLESTTQAHEKHLHEIWLS